MVNEISWTDYHRSDEKKEYWYPTKYENSWIFLTENEGAKEKWNIENIKAN